MKLSKILNIAYSLGAALVVFAAWSKLLHIRGANTFLTIGLLTEVGIFIVYAFAPEETATEVHISGGIQGASFDATELNETMKRNNTILERVFNTK